MQQASHTFKMRSAFAAYWLCNKRAILSKCVVHLRRIGYATSEPHYSKTPSKAMVALFETRFRVTRSINIPSVYDGKFILGLNREFERIFLLYYI